MLTVASRGEPRSADLILETKGSHGRILRQGISFGFFLIKDLSIDLAHLGQYAFEMSEVIPLEGITALKKHIIFLTIL